MTPVDGTVHVLHVMFSLQPGGMEHGVLKLVNNLDARKVRSSICSTSPGGALRALVQPGVPVFELQRRAGNDPKLVWRLYQLFRRERPDIVHTHSWGTLLEGLAAARCARVPIVVHGEHGTLQLKRHQRWFQRRGWSAADQVLSVSSRLAQRIAVETGFPLDRIRIIRNGVDLSRFGTTDQGMARKVLGIAPRALVATTVGRLVAVKDHKTLLEGVAQLRNRRDVVALIAGDGPLRDQLAEYASALGIASAVRFLGHRPDVETILAAADVFVLSSASEGLSNTILEAMATGLPVIATDVGGADELVQEGRTGRLVPSRSPRDLADALDSLLGNDGLRHSMGAAARARVESEFSLQAMVQRYQTLYCELVDAKRHPRATIRPSASAVGQSEVA